MVITRGQNRPQRLGLGLFFPPGRVLWPEGVHLVFLCGLDTDAKPYHEFYTHQIFLEQIFLDCHSSSPSPGPLLWDLWVPGSQASSSLQVFQEGML